MRATHRGENQLSLFEAPPPVFEPGSSHVNPHRRPTMFQRPDQIRDPLYVVCPIFNPQRWRSRWRLYQDFAKHCQEAGAILYTIEVAFGDREFSITESDNPRHIQLRSNHELWLKENLINLCVQRLPQDWKYVAWVDGDVLFARADWANETLHALQHYAVVQMWSQFQDLNTDHEIVGTAAGFMDCYMAGLHGEEFAAEQAWVKQEYPYPYPTPGMWPKRRYPGAPGLAWAARRDAWDAIGGLYDSAILGACDWYMAAALVGRLDEILSPSYTDAFKRQLHNWQERCEKYIKRNVGVVKGLALHQWHGPKVARRYSTRDQLLLQEKYDPELDLKRDWQGLYQLTDRNYRLRDGIRAYFRQRNEDQL